ncbi:YopX family protein [Priestia aryabhattai]|uniref:YopX family protein n=1 Tax=Priestia aryabhattai TaxID=412384 RepID=UPI002E1AB174|nr:YopX family protein [Priestia aryabhattai]MED4257716.1 YopX family protein [Priestia aryabhattai]
MREIKYKALVVKTQLDNLGSNMHLAGVSEYEEMINVQTISFDNGKVDYVTDEDMEEYSFADNSLKAVVQYTGLKDKNGKEIYEGDIIVYEINNGVGIESYCAQVFWSENKDKHKNSFEWLIEYIDDNAFDSLSRPAAYNGRLEVIGNIHENPELVGEAI